MQDIKGIVPPLTKALAERGYDDLTPVQEAMLAPELEGADALVSAQTGSGKTVAFGLALAPTLLGDGERFEHAGTPQALVIAPTRELAMQVTRELEWLYAFTGAKFASCVGGMDMRTERRTLERGAHIVVGTPGRLKDHIMRRSLDLSDIRAVVLDEADEMLDLGFREDLEFILGSAPEDRRTLMFSATVPRSIAQLAKNYQKDAVRVQTTEERDQHVDIEYRAMVVAPRDRENAIINVLRYYEARNALVFCATRATVNHMTARFRNRGFSVVALSGELSQDERSRALQAMRDGRARVCIATDVAARGIDLPGLELVVHADLPSNSETLLHRSGRTGRAGNKGVCAIIVPMNFRRKAQRLLQNARVEANWAPPPTAEEVTERDNERLLTDPVLTEPVGPNDEAFVQQLLEAHPPAQLAAAFVRLYRASSSAPEELEESPADAAKPSRDDFKDSVWISLSVGRDQKAEPRWLLPLLCRSGDITKREIGAIRVQAEETHVQLTARCYDAFMKAIGPDGRLEDNIRVTPLDDPSKAHSSPRPSPVKTRTDKPAARPERTKDRPREKRPYNPDAKSGGKPTGKPDRKPVEKRPSHTKGKAAAKPEYKSRGKPEEPNATMASGDGGAAAKKGTRQGDRPGDKPVYRKKGKPTSGKISFKDKPRGGKAHKAKPAARKTPGSRDPSVSLRKARPKRRKP
ncbi:MAG: DEAD/DEAH box helicase [Alphaproteobacteria bacterium]